MEDYGSGTSGSKVVHLKFPCICKFGIGDHFGRKFEVGNLKYKYKSYDLYRRNDLGLKKTSPLDKISKSHPGGSPGVYP